MPCSERRQRLVGVFSIRVRFVQYRGGDRVFDHPVSMAQQFALSFVRFASALHKRSNERRVECHPKNEHHQNRQERRGGGIRHEHGSLLAPDFPTQHIGRRSNGTGRLYVRTLDRPTQQIGHRSYGNQLHRNLARQHTRKPFKKMAQFPNRMHDLSIALARCVRGEALSSSTCWNHRR